MINELKEFLQASAFFWSLAITFLFWLIVLWWSMWADKDKRKTTHKL